MTRVGQQRKKKKVSKDGCLQMTWSYYWKLVSMKSARNAEYQLFQTRRELGIQIPSKIIRILLINSFADFLSM